MQTATKGAILITKRQFLQQTAGAVAALSLTSAATTVLAQPLTRMRISLDWKNQGHHAMFYMARDKGYFKQEGLEVAIDQGEGSSGVVTRVMSGVFDAGYGDVNTLIEQAATRPEAAPVMVYMFHYRAPFTMAVRADGPIKTINDLPGKTIGSSAGSSAFRLFPLLGKLAKVDLSTTKVLNVAPAMQEQLLIKGDIEGVLNFGPTTYMNLYLMKKDPAKDFRWFYYADHGVDLYGNGILVSKKMIAEKPEAVRGFLRAVNRALTDLVQDTDAAVAAMAKIDPLFDPKVEKMRVKFMMDTLFKSPEHAAIGFGDIDDARLAKSIETLREGFDLQRTPTTAEVFNRSFLPPKEQRSFAF